MTSVRNECLNARPMMIDPVLGETDNANICRNAEIEIYISRTKASGSHQLNQLFDRNTTVLRVCCVFDYDNKRVDESIRIWLFSECFLIIHLKYVHSWMSFNSYANQFNPAIIKHARFPTNIEMNSLALIISSVYTYSPSHQPSNSEHLTRARVCVCVCLVQSATSIECLLVTLGATWKYNHSTKPSSTRNWRAFRCTGCIVFFMLLLANA